jgi:hypothetical protein
MRRPPVDQSPPWPHLTASSLRNDRLLHEADSTGGDVKRLGDLFGISPRTAYRFTKTLGHPDLQTPQPGRTDRSR